MRVRVRAHSYVHEFSERDHRSVGVPNPSHARVVKLLVSIPYIDTFVRSESCLGFSAYCAQSTRTLNIYDSVAAVGNREPREDPRGINEFPRNGKRATV